MFITNSTKEIVIFVVAWDVMMLKLQKYVRQQYYISTARAQEATRRLSSWGCEAIWLVKSGHFSRLEKKQPVFDLQHYYLALKASVMSMERNLRCKLNSRYAIEFESNRIIIKVIAILNLNPYHHWPGLLSTSKQKHN